MLILLINFESVAMLDLFHFLSKYAASLSLSRIIKLLFIFDTLRIRFIYKSLIAPVFIFTLKLDLISSSRIIAVDT